MVNRPLAIDSLFRAAALVLLCAGLVVVLQPEIRPTARQQSLRRCVAAFQLRRADALSLAESHREAYPADLVATLLAAEARGRLSEHSESIALFEEIPRDGGRWEFARELGVARRCLTLGWLDRAEPALRRALSLNPDSVAANDLLGKILLWEGRAWEAVDPQFRVLMRGQCRGDELIGVSATDRFIPTSQDLDLNVAKDPSKSIAMKIAAARTLTFEGRTAESERLLRQVVAERPELGEAQGRLGRIIADRGNTEEFLRWRGTVPAKGARHPEVLFVEGLMARRLRQTEGAAHCFLRALELSPDHLGANIQAAICLEQLGKPALAAEFSHRGGVLSDLESKLNLIRESYDEKRIKELADLLGGLGRYWEAAGWNYVLTQTEFPREAARRDMRHWLTRARSEPSSRFGVPLPTSRIRAEDFATPRWPLSPPGTQIGRPSVEDASLARPEHPQEKVSPPEAGSAGSPSPWRFDDDARRAGIDFAYFEGTTEENRLKHIFNVMGGGLGALDFDQDGWPDLYIAQANHSETPKTGSEVSDRLYRNLDGLRFADATSHSRLGDSDFSHGVTAGDFNQDGFPDVYVGNLGPNRLHENLGDGTFEDVTQAAGVAGNEWSTSSVFADLNQDGLPDLYVLNYTKVETTRATICRRQDGREMACTPDVLPADEDRLYLNEGDGRFRDVSETAGIRRPDGRGLGVVAWDFNGDGRLGLFVGNDTTENYLFVNQATSGASEPLFADEGVVRGCAFDVNGNALATMGIAAADVTGDGRIDLLTTNFFADASTLYAQASDGSFEDRTREMNLREPSYSMLGFGCQFTDFDLDGWDDAIVTNGHVDQRDFRGGPDRMRPQLFHNLEGRNFAEVPPESLGAFFQSTYLGRGLAVFDWNRDGLTDVGISHLHAPFALLTNRTVPAGRPLSIRLIGRNGCREPTGASVTVRVKNREMTRLMTAGDGFLATNERRLLFSIPNNADKLEAVIRWPGREIETLVFDAGSSDLAIVEGTGRTFVLHRFPPLPSMGN